MVEVCKTKQLKALIPWEDGMKSLVAQTGVSQRSFYRIQELESYETNEKTADEILSKLGLVHLYYTLDFYEQDKDFSVREHGQAGYRKGCRCACCKRAHTDAVRRQRRKNGVLTRSEAQKKRFQKERANLN